MDNLQQWWNEYIESMFEPEEYENTVGPEGLLRKLKRQRAAPNWFRPRELDLGHGFWGGWGGGGAGAGGGGAGVGAGIGAAPGLTVEFH